MVIPLWQKVLFGSPPLHLTRQGSKEKRKKERNLWYCIPPEAAASPASRPHKRARVFFPFTNHPQTLYLSIDIVGNTW
jgi:hypothetical protein